MDRPHVLRWTVRATRQGRLLDVPSAAMALDKMVTMCTGGQRLLMRWANRKMRFVHHKRIQDIPYVHLGAIGSGADDTNGAFCHR